MKHHIETNVTAALALALALFTLIGVKEAKAASQLASTAATQLTSGYRAALRSYTTDPMRAGDIHMVCVQHVFRQWTDAYFKSLKPGPLKPQDVGAPLVALARMWFESERNLAAINHYRPNISRDMQSVFEAMLKEKDAPAKIENLTLTFEEIRYAEYAKTLKLCSSTYLLKETSEKAGAFAATTGLPQEILDMNRGEVSWIAAVEGGITPTVGISSGSEGDHKVAALSSVVKLLSGTTPTETIEEPEKEISNFNDLLARIQTNKAY